MQIIFIFNIACVVTKIIAKILGVRLAHCAALRRLAMRGLIAKRIGSLRVAPRCFNHQPDFSHLLLLLLSISLLGSRLEVAVHKGRHVILVGNGGAASLSKAALINDILQESILLRANLLQDVWEHILHLLRLWLSDHVQEVLLHREHNCTNAKGRVKTSHFLEQ